MAISETKLVTPEEPRPGIPLKKSTLAVLAIGLLALAFLSSVIWQSSETTTAQSMEPAGGASEPRSIGTTTSIEDEERLAREAVRPPSATPQAAPVSPLPTNVQRNENTAALYDRPIVAGGGRVAADQELEYEAQSRTARALVADFTNDRNTGPESAVRTGGGMLAEPQGGQWQPGKTQAPSEALQPTIDAAMAALRTEQTGSDASKSWLKEYSQQGGKGGKVLTSYQASESFILHQGSVIPAVLGRQINSDLPGEITAFTTVDVYDSLGRGHLLIPKGSRLVGAYDSDVKVGQSRVLFAFERLVLPNGISFDLPAAVGSDLHGASGLDGNVNNHFFKMFTSSFLIAMLADKTKQPTNVTNIGSSGPSNAAGQVLSDVSKSILERNRVIKPTITIDQGARLNVQVVSDMVFPGAYRNRQ